MSPHQKTTFAVAAVVLLFSRSVAAADASADRFIAVAPCRVDDTRFAARNAGEAAVIQVDVRKSRCGPVVPGVAVAYALRVNTYERPAHVGTVAFRQQGALARYPAGAPLAFPVGAAEHISVDLEGYYIPPGVTVDPVSVPSTSGSAITADEPQALRSGVIGSNQNADGTIGKIYLDGDQTSLYGAGVLAEPKTTDRGWTIVKSGESAGSTGFAFYNAAGLEILSVTSSGFMKMPAGTLMSGRSVYYNGPIVGNVVHDVSIPNPRDANGTALSEVTFFRAKTQSETGSPATTKFQASTAGGNGSIDVNFDSRFHYHWPASTKYHFRAFSDHEDSRGETFWVRAAVTSDSARNVADMYVSGKAGFGTKAAAAQLHVEDLFGDAELLLSSGDNSGVANYPTFTLMRKDGNDVQLAKYGLRLDSDDANKFKLLYGGAGGFTHELVTVDTSGNMVIGSATRAADLQVHGSITGAKVLGAVYQDLAEWVPATTDMVPGTVVVLNPDKTNEVMPSAVEYDVRVAGVVSAQPGVLLGVGGDSKEMVATTGRVKVKVDATRAPIAVGDLLVSSAKSGVAMKSQPIDVGGIAIHRPGTIIGKALEPLASGVGEILVLLSLQ